MIQMVLSQIVQPVRECTPDLRKEVVRPRDGGLPYSMEFSKTRVITEGNSLGHVYASGLDFIGQLFDFKKSDSCMVDVLEP